ncbi:MAG TPA: hypothetical protein VFP68_21895 [Burkholderiaceae bacterium]|nr:hypothetical protein [Burkholderiaceae bacterium]
MNSAARRGVLAKALQHIDEAGHPRFHMHFTPSSASWPNLVERFICDFTEELKAMTRRVDTRLRISAVRFAINS